MLYDSHGYLASGLWGQAILDLIDLLGHENVFLSIYENDSGEEGAAALNDFKTRVRCDHEIVSDSHVPLDSFPTVTLPDGSSRHKRMPYLSEMRNRALRPLDRPSGRTYEKVLFLNDVFFNPVDAAQLLFSTHIGGDGRRNYLAACAVDFINPIKFYDTFATRDLDGYSMGVPFYPWFTNSGRAASRQDVLSQKDAVRVKSCWGGMVVLEARYLQSSMQGNVDTDTHAVPMPILNATSAPLRFRAELDLFYDASECCLLHADLLKIARQANTHEDSGIYLNPFIRVAYDPRTLSWLTFMRRFERLYSIPHWIVNSLASMPTYNPYRSVEQGQEFEEEIWFGDLESFHGGSWQIETNVARNGLYCGIRGMQFLVESDRKGDKTG
ncbi:hypothetical protein MMC11_002305 [Xylographa trunciseda]|nr:hypothetical protein [Xylographa trunciseda]